MRNLRFQSKKNFSRILQIKSHKKIVTTPTYFPAISSINNPHDIRSLLNLVIRSSFPQVLISAYDFNINIKNNKKLVSALKKYSKKHFVFVDSGGFEKYWKKDSKWKYTLYEKTIKKIPSDFYSSFDGENNSKSNEKKLFKTILTSSSILPDSQYLPIFHADSPKKLISTLKNFLTRYAYTIGFIAIREKECGFTIFERARTIRKIRKIINEKGNEHVLHILGTGDPLSIALYSYCGADSFDSTDWYTSTLDVKTVTLRDSSSIELLQCPCRACKKITNFHSKLLLHNLDSYNAFMQKIRIDIQNSKLKSFLIKNGINKKVIDELSR